jgi:O-antigen ligase
MKKSALRLFKQKPAFFLSLILLGILPFLDGGTHIVARVLILIFPLPVFLIGIASGEIQFKKLPKWLNLFWWAFLVFVGFSVINSASLLFSLPEFFQLLAVFLLFNLFCLISDKESIKYAAWLVFIVSFILCLLSFHYLLPWTGRPGPMNLVYATYGHSHLADYLLLVIPLCFAQFLLVKKKNLKLFFGGLLIFYLISFVLTFSRGAFLVLPLVILLLIFLLRPKTALKKLVGWSFVLIPLGLILLILIFSFSSFGLERKIGEPSHWLIKQLVKPEFQAKRIDYWQQALEGFKARPLFGFGWGTFEMVSLRFQSEAIGWSSFTHNFYFQVLAEAGIFAFLSFLGFLFVSFDYLWRLVRKNLGNPLLVGGAGAILASSFHSFFDFDWHFPAVFLTFLFLLANLLSRPLASRGGRPACAGREIPPLRWKKICQGGLIFLAFLVYIFGTTQVAGEYFYFKRDYQKALLFSPWPSLRVRRTGDKIFERDFVEGEKTALRVVSLSREDSLMYFWLADKYFDDGQLEKAAKYYQTAIIFNPLGNYHLYPKLGEIYAQLGKEEKKDKLYQSFRQKLEETQAYRKVSNRLAKVLYSIGMDYLDQGRNQETIFWWESSIRAAPEWSYFYVDLASLYLILGEPGQAKAVLDNCLSFHWPRKHCQEYVERLEKNQEFEPPGFWREKILEIPDL